MIPGASPTATARPESAPHLRSFHSVPTASKVEPGRRPIFRPRPMNRPAGAQDGFTLLETVCVVAIIAMLAAVLLPILPRETSRPRLEAYAVETASLLNADRTTAIRRRMAVATQVDAASRSIRSGASGHVVHIPDDVSIDAVLPQRC